MPHATKARSAASPSARTGGRSRPPPPERVRLWDARTHTQLGQPLKHQTGVVTFVAFSPDGDSACGRRRGLREHGAALGRAHTHQTRPTPKEPTSLRLRPRLQPGRAHARRRRLELRRHLRNGAALGHPHAQEARPTPEAPGRHVNGVAFSPDGRHTSTTGDGTVDVSQAVPSATVVTDHGPPNGPVRPRARAGLQPGRAHARHRRRPRDGTAVGHTRTQQACPIPERPRWLVNAVAFSLDGHTVATVAPTERCGSGTATHRARPTRRGHRGSARRRLQAGRADARLRRRRRTVRLWNVVATGLARSCAATSRPVQQRRRLRPDGRTSRRHLRRVGADVGRPCAHPWQALSPAPRLQFPLCRGQQPAVSPPCSLPTAPWPAPPSARTPTRHRKRQRDGAAVGRAHAHATRETAARLRRLVHGFQPGRAHARLRR